MTAKQRIFEEFAKGLTPRDLKDKYPVKLVTLYRYHNLWKQRERGLQEEFSLYERIKALEEKLQELEQKLEAITQNLVGIDEHGSIIKQIEGKMELISQTVRTSKIELETLQARFNKSVVCGNPTHPQPCVACNTCGAHTYLYTTPFFPPPNQLGSYGYPGNYYA